MVGILINRFGGVIPRVGARLLPPHAAQVADNLKAFSGELRSWKRPSTVNTPTKGGNLVSMYRIYTSTSTAWLAWSDDVDAARSPIAGDTAFKLYYTGDTSTATNYAAGPRKTNYALATGGGTNYPMDFLEMGVPAPGAGPTVIGTGGTSTTSETRTYVYTYVTSTASWAEEGPPSPVGTGTGKTDAVWCISSMSTGTTGKYAFSGGIKRVYRTLTDNAGNTNYQLALDNVAISTSSAQDTVADADLGVICPSFINGVVNSEWVAPPSDLKGLMGFPNGIMVGFSGNQLCFSEPFYPHAWPIRYRLTTPYDIVGMGVYGQTIILATKGYPYAVSGSRPDAMAMSRIEESRPCVSKRSVASFPFGVLWATPDGLALAGPGGAILATDPFMKRDEWQTLCFPSTIIGCQYQNVYFGFFSNGSDNLNFIFDKDNANAPLTFGTIGAQGAWQDPETSVLYLLRSGIITQWDSDTLNNAPFEWRSKTLVLSAPVNFGAAQVEADFESLDDAAEIASQATLDAATNATILGTGAADTAQLTAWAATSSYGTASGATAASVVKSVNGTYMAVCVVAGTSSDTEPTWPVATGGTSTDGTVQWKRIHDSDGVTRGALREYVLRNYAQYSTADPPLNGTAGNQSGFPTRGSLLLGGTYTTFDERSLRLDCYAISTSSTSEMTLVHSQNVSSREPFRLPAGFKSDTWEFRVVGNVATRYFKLAETVKELGKLG